MKTSELTGAALDWAVDFARMGEPLTITRHNEDHSKWMFFSNGVPFSDGPRKYSCDWSEGGPIIKREKIGVCFNDAGNAACKEPWCAATFGWMVAPLDDISDDDANPYYGPTPLIAAMRCYVASKLGDEIEIPKELVE